MTFTEDAKQNFKDNFRKSIEDRTGLIGQALRAKREEQLQEQETVNEVAKIHRTISIAATNVKLAQKIETSLIQIASNLEASAKSLRAQVTTQDETNEAMSAHTVTMVRKPGPSKASLKAADEDLSMDEEFSMLDLFGDLFDRIKKKPKSKAKKMSPKERAKRAAKKARDAAKRKGMSKLQQKQAAELAKKKALERARKAAIAEAKKAALEKAKKEAIKKAGEIAAKKAAKGAIKKTAIKAVAKNLAKATAKSIPFVGAAVGVGFAIGKLIQGDWVGAGVEAASGVGSAVTAIPAAVYGTVRDVYEEVYGVLPESDPKRNERLEEVKKIVNEAVEEYLGKKVDPQPPTPAKKPAAATTAQVDTIPPDIIIGWQGRTAIDYGTPVAVENEPVPIAQPPVGGTTPPPSAPYKPAGPVSGGEEAVMAELKKEGFDPTATAMILAQASHESGRFKFLEENLNYSASRLKAIFPKYFANIDPTEYDRQPEKIANLVYGNRMGNGTIESGDGWKYRGRGFIGLTGKSMYEQAGRDIGVDLLGNPDLASDPAVAAKIVVWFFKKNLKRIPDWTDVTQVTKVVNGGTIGLADRKKEFEHYYTQVVSAPTTMAQKPSTGSDVGSTSSAVTAMKNDQKKGNDVTVVAISEQKTVTKPGARPGGRTEISTAVG